LSDIKSLGASGKQQHVPELQMTATIASATLVSQHCSDSAADVVTLQDLSMQSDQAVLNIMTDPQSSSSSSSASNSSSSSDGDEGSNSDTNITIKPTAAAAAAAEASASAASAVVGSVSASRLSISPLCPVVSLDSFSAQACLKLLLHVAAYAGKSTVWLCQLACRLHKNCGTWLW
jgi:hypothetical protein